MRKKMIAMLFVLILTLSGCADVSTVPEESDNYELVTETEAAAETESTESSSFSESTESKSAKTNTALESDAEATACEPVESETPKQTEPVLQEENNVYETKPAVTESSSAPSEKSEETEPPVVIPPQTVPEDAKPKTAYDYEFDIEAVKADCIGIGLGMGLALDSSLTPSNSTWWKPVTASQNNQGARAFLCCRRDENLRLVRRGEKARTRPETVYSLCPCKRHRDLRIGTDDGSV